MSKPEAAVEDYLVECTEARDGWAAKMVDIGRIGAPDRELRFPGPLTIYAETKAKNGRLRPGQPSYHEALREMGYTVVVLWTIEQVDKFFLDYDRNIFI